MLQGNSFEQIGEQTANSDDRGRASENSNQTSA